MANLGEFVGSGSGTTKLLLHLNGNSTDSSGNGNNGIDTAITYSQANGKFGQGAGFNGSSSMIQFGSTGFPIGSSNRTISLWVKQAAQPGSGQRHVWFVYGTRSNYQLISFDYVNGSGTYYVSIGTYYQDVDIAQTLTNGVWYNIVAVIDNKTGYLYLNGNLIGSGSLSNINTSRKGGIRALGHIVDGNYLNGSIDEVIVENRAWTASEVKKYFTYAKGRFGII